MCLPARQTVSQSQSACNCFCISIAVFVPCVFVCVLLHLQTKKFKTNRKTKENKEIYIYFLHLVIARRWCYLCRKIEIGFKRCLLCFHLKYNKKENIVVVIQQHFSHNKQHSVKIKCKWMEKILGISDRLIIMQFLKIPSNKCHQMKVVLLLLFLLSSPVVYNFFYF